MRILSVILTRKWEFRFLTTWTLVHLEWIWRTLDGRELAWSLWALFTPPAESAVMVLSQQGQILRVEPGGALDPSLFPKPLWVSVWSFTNTLSLPWAAGPSATWPFVSWEQVSATLAQSIDSCPGCTHPPPAPSSHSSIGVPSGPCPQPLYPHPTGPVRAEIYQVPAFCLAGAGRDVTLQCEQSLRYNAMYWYRQDPGEGLRLIYYSTVEKDVQRGDIAEGYNVSREQKGLFLLTVRLAHTNQTAVYLCSGSAPQWGTATAHLCTNLLQPPLQPLFQFFKYVPLLSILP